MRETGNTGSSVAVYIGYFFAQSGLSFGMLKGYNQVRYGTSRISCYDIELWKINAEMAAEGKV